MSNHYHIEQEAYRIESEFYRPEDSKSLHSIAISLKRIADALERQAASPNAPIGTLEHPIMPGPRGWEVKS